MKLFHSVVSLLKNRSPENGDRLSTQSNNEKVSLIAAIVGSILVVVPSFWLLRG